MALEEVADRCPVDMLPGHGSPLTGEETIREACLTVSEAMRYLDQQVVDMLNRGMWQDEILHSFHWPEEYAESPYLAPIYGHPYFVVQALLRQYHGWYDGNPSHLFPSPGREIAREVVALSGGEERILERAERLEESGELQLSLHLLDFVLEGGGTAKRKALEMKARVLEKLASRERSLIARNIFLAGAREVRKKMEAEGEEG